MTAPAILEDVYKKSIHQSEVSILVMWFILTKQKRPLIMLAGSLQVPGYYDMSRDEN